MKNAIRQTILFQCRAWAWDTIDVLLTSDHDATSSTPIHVDIAHRISMIPAPEHGELDVFETNEGAGASSVPLPIQVGGITVYQLKPGESIRICGRAIFSSEMEGKHAKFSQHQCDAILNIETDSTFSCDQILAEAKTILRINLEVLVDMIEDCVQCERSGSVVLQVPLSDAVRIAANLLTEWMKGKWNIGNSCAAIYNDSLIVFGHDEVRRQIAALMQLVAE